MVAWKEDDPTLVTTYNDVESGVGASYSWTSEKSGAGTLAWVASDPPRHLKYSLVFEGQGDAGGDWTFEPVTEGVEVTWTFEGDAGKNPIGRYMGLMIDSMVGPYYQRGLDKLKQICEAMPEPMAAPADIAPADDDVDEYGEEPDDEDDAGASAVD